MVKNLIGGNKAKSMSNKKQNIVKIKLFKAPNEFEHIGKINKELGSARFSVETYFNKRVYVVNCSAPKSIRVKIDDYVLISLLRETKSIQGEIIHKYSPENIGELTKYDEPIALREKRANITQILNKGVKDDLFSEDVEIEENPQDFLKDDIDVDDI